MVEFISKLFLLIIVAFTVISSYYSGMHNEAFSGYSVYLIPLLIFYVVYKCIAIYFSKDKQSFTPLGLIGFALLNILLLCIAFFSKSGGGAGAFTLFFKIIGFLLLPSLIGIFNYGFGKRLLSNLKSFSVQPSPFRFMMSIGIGYVCFFTLLDIAAFFSFYNIYAVAIILVAFGIFSYKEIYRGLASLHAHKIVFDSHKPDGNFFELLNFKLLSAEFAFIILTFLIGVNFVNIVRPMPIGWDDLGVYMNWPQIMANSGSILHGTGLMAWQTFTGIGYMFHSAPQAFFFNQTGGILSIICLMVIFTDLLNDGKKRFLSLPIILATMFYSMPMVIFQQAKDMKLDPGLFSISIIGIYCIYHLYSRYLGYKEDTVALSEEIKTENENKIVSVYKSESGERTMFDNKDFLIYIGIIGTIVGLAFAIKVTTLMLILGIIGVIFYADLGFSGFMGFFFVLIGIFTRFKLWDFMNVSYPKDNVSAVNAVGYVSLIVGAILLGISFFIYRKESFKKPFLITLIFSLGVALPLVPWIAKNVSELKTQKISVGTLLGGESNAFVADYNKIYSPEELKKVQQKSISQSLDEKGQTKNEDMGRYFGYETGVNNYLKLPWNLTMQKNQTGEYTEITYFFLALLPIILLFLPFRNMVGGIGIVIITLGGWLYFGNFSITKQLTDFFSTQDMPWGYIYIIGTFIISLVYFLYALKNDRFSQLFKINAIFFTMYGLIFVVAAYGIVWYGIAMYFSLLLMIGIGASYISEQKGDDLEELVRFFASFIVMIIIGIYFFASTLPHGMNNLVQASFADYKAGLVNQEEGIFMSHPDYFIVLANLNLKDPEGFGKEALNGINDELLKKLITSNLGPTPTLGKTEAILREVVTTDISKLGLDAITQSNLKAQARNTLDKIYNNVLYPPKDKQNTDKIYRIGTFLTYFINNNTTRYYDDGLIFNFDEYFADQNPDVAVERMKKIGLKYLLVDLNAATIDKDPRHDLTRRYEELLNTFKSGKLELVQTDSQCLQIALDEKNNDYMTYAGVNYESYTTSGTVINRQQKQFACYNHIIQLMKENKISDTNYPYLRQLNDYFKKSNVTDQQQALNIFQQYVNHGWLALFRIK